MKMGILAAVGTALALSQAASAAVFLTFQDPAGAREVSYRAPTGGATLGTLTVTANVSLQFDLTSIGLGTVTYPSLSYVKTGLVSAATDLGDGDFKAEIYQGHFEYRDAGNNIVLSGDFGSGLTSGPNGGNLVINGTSGSIITNATTSRGSLSYTVGNTAIAPGTGGLTLPAYVATASYAFGAAIDGNWTLTGIQDPPALREDGFLADFDANAAFTGTIEVNRVPTPGTAALAGVAGLLLARRRRA